jgi:hypothetical protein
LTAPAQNQAPPKVRLEQIVSLPVPTLQGQVIGSDRQPQAGARVSFVSTARQEPHHSVTANAAGQFRVTLASGQWLVYVDGRDGKPVFLTKVELRDDDNRQLTLVRR